MANRTGSSTGQSGTSASKLSDSKTTKSAASKTSRTSLHEELEKASDGLDHNSESTYPFRFFSLPAESEAGLTAQAFLNSIGLSQAFLDEFNLSIDQVIEERPLDGFFPTLDDLVAYYGTDTSDPEVVSQSKRYRKLEAALRQRLRDLKVFRVGMVEVRCYVAGLDKQGNIAGLVTTSIET